MNHSEANLSEGTTKCCWKSYSIPMYSILVFQYICSMQSDTSNILFLVALTPTHYGSPTCFALTKLGLTLVYNKFNSISIIQQLTPTSTSTNRYFLNGRLIGRRLELLPLGRPTRPCRRSSRSLQALRGPRAAPDAAESPGRSKNGGLLKGKEKIKACKMIIYIYIYINRMIES